MTVLGKLMDGIALEETTQRRIHETSSEEMASSLQVNNEKTETPTTLMGVVQLAK